MSEAAWLLMLMMLMMIIILYRVRNGCFSVLSAPEYIALLCTTCPLDALLRRFDSQVAHPKLPCHSVLVQEEHMAQFVLHLAGTEFGAQHWDRTVLASAYHVLSDRRRGGNGGERAVKVSPSPLSSV